MEQPAGPPVVLVVSAGIVHPLPLSRFRLWTLLREIPGFRFVHCSPARLHACARRIESEGHEIVCIVLFFHRKKPQLKSLNALEKLVAGGAGLVAIHSASASWKTNGVYRAILGGRFVRHGAVETLRLMNVSDVESPLHDIPDTTIRDELYIHEYDPEIRIEFLTALPAENGEGPRPEHSRESAAPEPSDEARDRRSYGERGQGWPEREPRDRRSHGERGQGWPTREPQCWTRLYGKGRVFYFAPGHRSATFRNAVVRQIIGRGVLWAAGTGRGEDAAAGEPGG